MIKVLVVEDNPLNRKILLFYLQKQNYEVKMSATGEDAVELFRCEWFDAILMDLMLPGIDGFETTRQIRMMEKTSYLGKRSAIIALTANTLDNDRERCLRHNMDGYLVKPFDITKLVLIFGSLNLLKE